MTKEQDKISLKLLAAIFATGVMVFCGVVCETAMNVGFPTLMREFGVGTATVQWLTTGYLLILALIVPLSSFLKQRFHTRRLFVTASVLFLLGTLLCAMAGQFSLLLFGRLVQGVGTGIALPLMFNIVLEQAPASKIGLLMGSASLITAMAPALGPVLGGLLIDAYSWRMIFWALVPLLGVSLLLGAVSITQTSALVKAHFALIDYLLLAVCFVCFILAIERLSEGVSLLTLGLFAVSLLALWGFVVLSRRKEPLIHLSVFANRTFLLSVGYILIVQFVVLALGYLIPNYSQLVASNSASVAGSLLLPGTLLGAVLAPISGKLFDTYGARPPIVVGSMLVVVSLLLFSGYSAALTTLLFMVFYVLYALGQGLSVGNTMTNGLRQLTPELQADGNAVINTLQQLAGAVGTAIAAALVAMAQRECPTALAESTLRGSQHAFCLLAILGVIGAVLVGVMFYGRKKG